MAIRVWSLTIVDDEARLLLTLVDQDTHEFHERQAWYVDDARNRLRIQTEQGVQSRHINPVFSDRRQAADEILAAIITAINPT